MLANSLRSFTFAATLLSISFGICSIASAGHHDRVDRLAVRVQKNAQRLLEETTRYRHVPEYRHLVQDTCLLRDTAIHIHDVTHFEGNLRHLKQDVAMIDQTTHHLQDLVKHIEREASHGHGHGHNDVNTRRAKNLLKQIERDVHSLSDELAEISKVSYQSRPQTYRKPATNFNTYGNNYKSYSGSRQNSGYGATPYKVNRNSYNRTASGFSIGGGSSRIWIGF